MQNQLRLVILVGIGIFCLDNINYTPAPPEPEEIVVEAVDNPRERLMVRREWLAYESMAYALYSESALSGNEARGVVASVVREARKYENLDYQLVLGLIIVESNGDDRATSPVGARGLMQIMPATGQYIAASFSEEWEGQRSLYQVEKNIRYGIWYLNHLQEQFPDNRQAMVAAYNWGPVTIQNRLEEGRALPKIYPGKVKRARERIEEKMYDFHRTHLWRCLDLSQDLPYFPDDSDESGPRPGYRGLLVHDAEGKLLREGPGVQQVSQLVLGGDRHILR